MAYPVTLSWKGPCPTGPGQVARYLAQAQAYLLPVNIKQLSGQHEERFSAVKDLLLLHCGLFR
jgi:hypothetical protein